MTEMPRDLGREAQTAALARIDALQQPIGNEHAAQADEQAPDDPDAPV